MAILDSYQRKAKITTKMLNSLKDVSCNPVTGSLYAFPKVILPQKAVEEAKVRRSSSKPIDLLRYGDHIEFIRFKEYYGMPRGHSLSIYARFVGKKENFIVYFSGKRSSLLLSNTAERSFFP